MDPAERRRIAQAVIGAMLLVFCLALSLMFIDGVFSESKKADSSAAVRSATIGAERTFNIYDYSLDKRVMVKMVCVSVGRHSIIYKEPLVKTTQTLLRRITTEFDENIYPADRSQFLGKPIMGMGNEDKIIMLLLNSKRGLPADLKAKVVSGYYSQDNEQLKLYKSESNEARIIHIFVGGLYTNEDSVIETVAHEARHLKNWDITKNNVGLIIGSLFAIATIMTLYLVLSNLYLRSFSN